MNPDKPFDGCRLWALVAPRPAPAFTLIELLVTIAVIVVLAMISFGLIGNARTRAQMSLNVANLRALGVASLNYGMDNGGNMPNSSNDRDGEQIRQTTGNHVNLYAAPRRLLGSSFPGGSGHENYVDSADVFYGPFTSAFAARLPGRFYSPNGPQDVIGPFKIGYIFYSLPTVEDSSSPARSPLSYNIGNDRIGVDSVNPRTPLYSDILDLSTLVADTGFTGPKCAVVHLDGSVSLFERSQIRAAGNTNAAIYLMAGVRR